MDFFFTYVVLEVPREVAEERLAKLSDRQLEYLRDNVLGHFNDERWEERPTVHAVRNHLAEGIEAAYGSNRDTEQIEHLGEKITVCGTYSVDPHFVGPSFDPLESIKSIGLLQRTGDAMSNCFPPSLREPGS